MPNDPTPSFRDPFAALYAEVKRGMVERQGQLAFFAIVVTYTEGPPETATVTRIGSEIEEGPYRVAGHVGALVAGDRVKVEDVTGEGGYVIAYMLAV